MSYDRQTGLSGSNTGAPPSLQEIGAKIAGNQGGLQYENKPGASLSGGAAPERNTYSSIPGSEPGYEHISAPNLGGTSTGGVIESSGGPTYTPSSLGQQGTGSTTDYGQKYGAGSIPSSLGSGSAPTGSRPETGTASIAGGGINKETVGTGTGTGSTLGSGSTTGTTGGNSGYVANAQKTVEPYVAQAKDAAAPYVQKAQEVGSAALETARPYLNQASEKATQAYNAATTELDARGINRDSTQQKLAEVGQTMKDYGAVGQQRAGEYLQQAVDQAKTIGQDRENKSIVATIFGTVFLIWLAFGFSIGAIFALGVAGSIAAVLSRYSRHHTTGGTSHTSGQYSSIQNPTGRYTSTQNPTGQYSSAQNPTGQYSSTQNPTGQYTSAQNPTGQYSSTQNPTGQFTSGQSTSGQLPSERVPGTTSNLATPGVETHYPRPAHPDNSLHTNIGQ